MRYLLLRHWFSQAIGREQTIMADQSVTQLKQKIAQAREVIAHLMDKAAFNGAEAHRALDYFGGDTFERNFLPWPRHGDEGLRPDQLNAANDD
jgi:catalase (peroxidase I)